MRFPLIFESGCVSDDDVWFSASDFNGLYKMSLKSKKIEYIGEFPNENGLKRRMHYGEALKVGSKIYFLPLESRYMNIYNLKNNTFESYCIAQNSCGLTRGVIYGDYIYMFSTRKSDTYRYNTVNNVFEKVPINNEMSKRGYCHGYYKYKNMIYLIQYKSNILCQLDFDNLKMNYFYLSKNTDEFQIIGGKKELVYVINQKNSMIYTWNIKAENLQPQNIFYPMKLNSWQTDQYIVGNNKMGEKLQILYLDNHNIINTDVFQNENSKEQYIIQFAFEYQSSLYFIFNNTLYSIKDGIILLECDYDKELEKIRLDIAQNTDLKESGFDVLDEGKVLNLDCFLKCVLCN